MAASVFHLGRPLHSWRAFIGVRRSWLSREIVALNALAFGVLLQLAAGALPLLSSKGYGLAALVACSLTGAAALISSIMVYVDTPRVFWKFQGTAPRFIGTSLLLGCSGATLFFVEPMFFAAISVVACAKLAHELLIFRNLSGTREDPLARTARLMTTALSKVTAFRFVTLLLGGVVLAQLALAQQLVSPWIAPLIFLTLLLSEFSERSLFFRAVAQPKMPGGIS
jgi:DMSO reductase anchor subunit